MRCGGRKRRVKVTSVSPWVRTFLEYSTMARHERKNARNRVGGLGFRPARHSAKAASFTQFLNPDAVRSFAYSVPGEVLKSYAEDEPSPAQLPYVTEARSPDVRGA